jgi:hypothetical protein
VLTELEAPTALLTVAETEAMVCRSVVPVGGVPENVKGTETVNSPPRPCEVVLWNQTAEAWVKSSVTCEAVSVNPAAAVNCTFNEVKVRVVE